jgi:hypothetical protein
VRWLLLVAVVVAGCQDLPDGGIEGTATIGPTCPVQQEPPDPDCDDRPFEGRLRIVRDGHEVKRFQPQADGSFRVAVAPGTYRIQDTADAYPYCDAGPVTVVARSYARLDVACDSGIR